MRSIILLLILVMIGLNGKGQSVTALPDSVLSQCCLEVTLLNGNVTTVDWVFIQYITRDGTGTKLFVEYAPNFGGIQWETQIRIQDDFDDVLARSKFIILPFTVGTTDYGIHRNWIANLEENTTTGGTWVYGRFGTPAKRKFSAVEDYETLKNLLLACRPRAIVVAENGLYTEGDTVRMGGFLIEPTVIETNTYPFTITDDDTGIRFGLSYNYVPNDTVFYFDRFWGSGEPLKWNRWYFGRNSVTNYIQNDTTSVQVSVYNQGNPTFNVTTSIGSARGSSLSVDASGSVFGTSNFIENVYANMGTGLNSSSMNLISDSTITGLIMGLFRMPVTGKVFMALKTPKVDDTTAVNGQFLQLKDVISGEVEFATIDLSGYLEIADTAAMLDPYIQGAGTVNYLPKFTAGRAIGNSNIQDNNTAVSILNSKPFALGQWTTAGRPTGTQGYLGYNTTTNGIDWYNGTRWATALESTFARGSVTGGLLYTDVNGQGTQSANLTFSTPNLTLGGSNPYIYHGGNSFRIKTTTDVIQAFELRASSSWGTRLDMYAPGDATKVIQLATTIENSYVNTASNFGIGNNSPQRKLHVTGEARITDLTTDAPTRIVGADADGDLADITWLNPTGNSLGVGIIPTQQLDVNGDVLIRDTLYNTNPATHSTIDGLAAWKNVSGLGYAAGKVTLGSGLSVFCGVLSATSTADGNGIYTGSGTLSQHTTRALIPSTGNLFFSQKFNANADSAYFNIVNYLDGERSVNFGVTDTSSTGYSRGYFESDGAGSMNWGLQTSDVNGNTTVRALEGELDFITTAGNISLSAPVDQEVQITGMVRAKQEGYYEINSTSSPQNLSNTYSDNYINQGSTQASFTLVFPASPEDGQILKITYNNAISSLTLDGNGNTIVGTTVTTAVAGSQRVFKFYAGDSVWIRQN